ncbi:putative ribosomally synthesized peptide with SipW-like signal peptide [Microbacterium keratanolyticum]|nr:SipW-dependent-type signal peptide-containing protein [Microbacterium keratanolyticum]MBM7469575.1 putative ribosomally synthesized peptide with SipW-like signal peptide [Microbacterium keratanolyticum]
MSKNNNRRKVLAVLAGGLVLGVGAAVTLAAWNDSEFATGTFTAGSFDLEGSITSGTTGFANHNTAGTAQALSFTLPAGVVNNMSPGQTVYAPFWVRLAANTTSDATVIPAAITAGTGGNEANMSYSISVIGVAETCNQTTAAAGTTIATGSTLSALTGAASTALVKGSPTTAAGTAIQMCFAVTAGNQASLVQGASATATWRFEATSTN